MKRSFLIMLVVLSATTSSASACCLPYIPWLDPFAWLGMHGCGNGCGYNTYGYNGFYNYPRYGYQPMYTAPQMSYPVAPASGDCNCGASAGQTFSTGFNGTQAFQPVVGYQPHAFPGHRPMTAWSPMPTYPSASYPTTAYYQPQTLTPTQVYNGVVTSPGQSTIYTAPQPVNQPGQPPVVGDMTGDHEIPTQSAVLTAPQSVYPLTPVYPTFQPPAARPIRPVSFTSRMATNIGAGGRYPAAVR